MKTMLLISLALLTGCNWESIASRNGERVANDEGGRPCYYYEKDQQLICYKVLSTWYGQDAVPSYVIDHGTRTVIYD